MFSRKNNPLTLISLLILIFAFIMFGFINESEKNELIRSIVGVSSSLKEKTTSSGKQERNEYQEKFRLLSKVTNTLDNWPPEVGAKFFYHDYFDESGKRFNLEHLQGKPTLVMLTAASSPGSLAWAGGHEFGDFKGHQAQNNLSAISEYYNYYTGGLELYSGEINFVHLMLYNSELNSPTWQDLKEWQKHFKLDRHKNVFVIAGNTSLANKESFARTPGFYLLDSDLTVIYDAAGGRGPDDLYADLLPAIAQLLK